MEIKLRRGIYLTFGITFALIVGIIVVWKLKFYDDVTSQITTTTASYDTASTTAKDLSKNLLAEAVAKDRVKLSAIQLKYFQQRFRSLNFDITTENKKNVTWRGYMNEYFANFGLEMRRELIQASVDSGVNINTTVKVIAPPQMPENMVMPNSGFLRPVDGGGTMTVEATGDLPSILAFLRRINRSEILMSIGNIKLEGASPAIKATFTITPFLVAKGPSIVLTAPAAAAAPASPEGTSPDGAPPTPPTTP